MTVGGTASNRRGPKAGRTVMLTGGLNPISEINREEIHPVVHPGTDTAKIASA